MQRESSRPQRKPMDCQLPPGAAHARPQSAPPSTRSGRVLSNSRPQPPEHESAFLTLRRALGRSGRGLQGAETGSERPLHRANWRNLGTARAHVLSKRAWERQAFPLPRLGTQAPRLGTPAAAGGAAALPSHGVALRQVERLLRQAPSSEGRVGFVLALSHSAHLPATRGGWRSSRPTIAWRRPRQVGRLLRQAPSLTGEMGSGHLRVRNAGPSSGPLVGKPPVPTGGL